MITFGYERHEGNEHFTDVVTRWSISRKGIVHEVRSRAVSTGKKTRWDWTKGLVPVRTPPIWGYDCFWYDGPHPTFCLGWLTFFWDGHRWGKRGTCYKCREDLS